MPSKQEIFGRGSKSVILSSSKLGFNRLFHPSTPVQICTLVEVSVKPYIFLGIFGDHPLIDRSRSSIDWGIAAEIHCSLFLELEIISYLKNF